jgi:hypothetical protein
MAIRSVIGGHLSQLNAKFRQICRGREVPGTLPSTTTASVWLPKFQYVRAGVGVEWLGLARTGTPSRY